MKKFFIMLVIIAFGLFSTYFAQEKSTTQVEEFRVVKGEVLDLKELQEVSKSPSHIHQPSFVTIGLKFENGIKKNDATWEKYMPHAGTEEFFEKVRSIVNTWTFNENAKATGIIYYTIATNGTIKIDLRDLHLPDYINYKFATPDLLVKAKGFEKDYIRAIMHEGQMYGKKEKTFFEKLGTTYVVIFSLLTILLIISIIFTWSALSKKVEPEEKIVKIISDLWINNALKLPEEKTNEAGEKIIIERTINEDNPDLDDEIVFLKRIAEKLSDGTFEKENENIPEIYRPPIKYKELANKILDIIGKAKSEDDKREAIRQVKSLIWEEYSLLFLKKAKDICEINKDYRISRIFLAGLGNHITNKDEWYTSSEIDRAVDKTAASELEQMKGWIDWLWVIGSVAPMFGLFGTVTGISSAFAEISQSSAGMEQAELITKLAGGINMALYTTIVGLVIGITASLIYYLLKSKLDSISTKWEGLFVEITNNF